MNVSKSANNANSSSNIPNPSKIPDIESRIQTIVKSWSFRCLGIGKAELNQQIQQLKTIAVSLNNIKNKTETTESNSNLKTIRLIFEKYIKPNVSEKNYLDLEANIIDILQLSNKIKKILDSYKYRLGFTKKKVDFFIEKFQDRLPEHAKKYLSGDIQEIKDEILWKSTKEKISKLKKALQPSQGNSETPQVKTKDPLSEIEKAEPVNTELTPIIRDSKGTIQTLEMVKKNPFFKGTIVFKGQELPVSRGGLDNKNKQKGTGGFGFLLYIEEDGKKGSIKEVIKITTYKEYEGLMQAEREAKTCKELYGLPGVLGASDTLVTKEASYIRMEYAARGDLRTELYRNKNMNIKKKIKYALNVLEGLKSIHNKRLLYKDLKPENIVLGENETVKLIDFGLVEEIGGRRFGGTLKYMAPEVLWPKIEKEIKTKNPEKHPIIEKIHNQGFYPAVDVYSFGVFLAELIGCLPQEITDNNPKNLYKRVDLSIKIPKENQNLIDLINRCLALDPQERPSIEDLISQLERLSKEL